MHYFLKIQSFSSERSASITLPSPFLLSPFPCAATSLSCDPYFDVMVSCLVVFRQEAFLLCRWGHWAHFPTSLFYWTSSSCWAYMYIALFAPSRLLFAAACCPGSPSYLICLFLLHSCFGNHIFCAHVYVPCTRVFAALSSVGVWGFILYQHAVRLSKRSILSDL